MSFMTTASVDPSAVQIIKNNGWFPDIDIPHMRDAMRLDGTVTDPRLAQAVAAAILHVNRELGEWYQKQSAAGHAAMSDITADQVNGESRLLIQYRHAVYCTAKADLLERYRDYDTTASTLNDKKIIEFLADSPAEQRRNAQWAIADICGRTHFAVELI